MESDPAALAALRAEYELGGLNEADLAPEPVAMFTRWFDEARSAGLVEANAMVLGTAGLDGTPASRTVLLKGVDEGFVFFTNYASRKGAELAAEPRCSLLFGWYALQRQIRVEGTAARITREETESYFATRPRDSQLGAWASPQSEEVGSREDLDAAYTRAADRFREVEIPAPPHWGGYRVVPNNVEFWQGRRGRMHDRLAYRRTSVGWTIHRLAP